jgi:hypothetical protein
MGSSTLCVAFAFLRYPRAQAFRADRRRRLRRSRRRTTSAKREERCLKHSLASKAMFGLSTGADRERKDGALCGMRRQMVPAHREAR